MGTAESPFVQKVAILNPFPYLASLEGYNGNSRASFAPRFDGSPRRRPETGKRVVVT